MMLIPAGCSCGSFAEEFRQDASQIAVCSSFQQPPFIYGEQIKGMRRLLVTFAVAVIVLADFCVLKLHREVEHGCVADPTTAGGKHRFAYVPEWRNAPYSLEEMKYFLNIR